MAEMLLEETNQIQSFLFGTFQLMLIENIIVYPAETSQLSLSPSRLDSSTLNIPVGHFPLVFPRPLPQLPMSFVWPLCRPHWHLAKRDSWPRLVCCLLPALCPSTPQLSARADCGNCRVRCHYHLDIGWLGLCLLAVADGAAEVR